MGDNLARKYSFPTQEIGRVVGVMGKTVRVRSALGEVEARRAASCLLEPELGDEVLVVHHERGTHVLSVLERDEEAPAKLTTEGDLHISAASGRISVNARDGVDVVTPGETVIASGTARVSAAKADVVLGALAFVGDHLTAHVDRIKTVAQSVETVSDRLVQRLQRAYRFIARSETVRTEYMDIEARAAFHVKSEATVVHSAGLTKLDGSQIHLG